MIFPGHLLHRLFRFLEPPGENLWSLQTETLRVRCAALDLSFQPENSSSSMIEDSQTIRSIASNARPNAPGHEIEQETHVTCCGCGIETTVPFKPTQNKPVLCRSCFDKAAKAVLLQENMLMRESSFPVSTSGSRTDFSVGPHLRNEDI